MLWRTLQTKYLPECIEPAASSCTTVPTRRIEPSAICVGRALATHEPAGLAQHRLRALGQLAAVVHRRT